MSLNNFRSDLCDVCQHKKEGCPAEFNSISASIDEDVKAQQQFRMQGNVTK